MKNLQILKKIVVMLALVAIVTCPMLLPQIAAKADATSGATTPAKAQLYMDYLGTDPTSLDTPLGLPAFKKTADATTDVGKVFWVGVRVKDLTAASFIKGGIVDMEIAIEYDPNYVEPVTEVGTATTWEDVVKAYNFGTDCGNTAWDSAKYDLSSYSGKDLSPDTSPGREEVAKSGWKMQYVSIMKKDSEVSDATSNRFYDISDDDSYYLLRLPFKLLDVPPTSAGNPLVLKLVRGPGTLVMWTNDTDGLPYQWEAEDRTDGTHNLKNYFNYNKDLNIFAESEADTMDSFKIEYETGDTTPTKVEVTDLYTDSGRTAANKVTFSSTVYEYYISVPAETKNLFLTMGTLTLANTTVERFDYGVTTGGDSITLTDSSGTLTGTVELKGTATGEYKDTIVIKVNNGVEGVAATEYRIHVARTDNSTDTPDGAYIKLNYGNSPYGEIERMGTKATGAWDSDYIATAKEKFNKNNKFVKDYVPDGYGTTTKYTLNAWFGKSSGVSDADKADPTKNLDRDPYALFVYAKQPFKEPGFTAVDSSGNTVDSSKVTRKIETLYTLTATAVKNWPDDKVVTHTDVAVTENTSGLIDVISTGNGTKKYVRPGVYAITYSFEDDASGKTISVKRPLVVMLKAGDANADNSVNGSDSSRVNNIVKGSMDPYTGYKESDLWIYKFRVLDVNYDGSVNGTDASRINNIVKGTTTAPTWYINME